MDPIKLLIKQHREVETLFAQHESGEGRRNEHFEQIEENLLAHALLEEAQVYPLLRERAPDGEELAQHAIEEHQKVEMTLKRMAAMDIGSDEYEAAMSELIQSVRHHVRDEEEPNGLFDKLRESLSKEEIANLGRMLSQEAGEEPVRGRQGGQGGRQKRSTGSQRSASRKKTASRRGNGRTRTSTRGKTGARGRATGRAAAKKSARSSGARRRSGAKRQTAKRQTRGRAKGSRR